MIKEQESVNKNKIGKLVSIYFTDKEHKLIKKIAKEDCLTPSSFVRRFLRKYLLNGFYGDKT